MLSCIVGCRNLVHFQKPCLLSLRYNSHKYLSKPNNGPSWLKSFTRQFVPRKNLVTAGIAFTAVGCSAAAAVLLQTKASILKLPIANCQEALVRPTLDSFEDETQSEKQIQYTDHFDWHQLWIYLKPHLLLFIGAIASSLIVAILNIQIPALLGGLVNVVGGLSSGNEAGALLSQLKGPAVKLIYCYCLQSVFTFLYIAFLSSMGERMACDIRKDLFSAILRQDIAFFDSHRTGELVNRLTTDVQDFKSAFKLCISQGLRSIAQTVGCVGTLYFISPKMTSIMLFGLPVMVGFGSILGSGLRQLSTIVSNQVEKATSVAEEAIGNVRTVRAFAMEVKEIELYEKEVEKASWCSEKLGIGIGAFQGLTNFALNGIVLGVMCMGGYMMTTENLSGGELMSFLVATQTIQRSLAQLSLLYGHFVKGMAAGARVFQYINLEPDIPLVGGRKIPAHTLRGDLEFRNVTFAYPTRKDQVILRDFNLRVPAGSVVAICGPSGGGKSTLAALLERYYDVDKGCVSIDGADVRHLDPTWLRGKAIGFINQEPVLFATTIMENIRYGRPSATDTEVMFAAKMANADDFIKEFPNGYQTIVGERGVTVSGGQKQRIAIARALLKNPAILILDEATSALDAESERQVQATLDKVVKGRTVLVIAHRLSTIQNADVIAVLAEGQIAEMGKHEALKKLGGLYWSLIKQQQAEELLHRSKA
ncbi:hypothetical protein CHUAL_008355 [Chamberlinius hualienensis]